MRVVQVLYSHGTVSSLEQLPEFLLRIRHGRPAPESFVQELRGRYERIGGSPLLRLGQELALAVSQQSGRETRLAQRLWTPSLRETVSDLESTDQVLLLPLAPYSVRVYEAAARAELEQLPSPPKLTVVPSYGQHQSYLSAVREVVQEGLTQLSFEAGNPEQALLLSAHSLPLRALQAGDSYQQEFESSALSLVRSLGLEFGARVRVVWQSQGEGGGAWLGPSLSESLKELPALGVREVCVAPIGFLTDHVETLYDLDIEAQEQAKNLGLRLVRAPTLGLRPSFVRALQELFQEALTPAE